MYKLINNCLIFLVFFAINVFATIEPCHLRTDDEVIQALNWTALSGENHHFDEYGLVFYHQNDHLTGVTFAARIGNQHQLSTLPPMAGDQNKPHQLLLYTENHELCSLGQLQILPFYQAEDLSAELLNIIEQKFRHLASFTPYEYEQFKQPFDEYSSALEALINGMVYYFDGRNNPKSIKVIIEQMADSADPEIQQAMATYHYLLIESGLADHIFAEAEQQQQIIGQQAQHWSQDIFDVLQKLSPLSYAHANLDGMNVMQGIKTPKDGKELSVMMKQQMDSATAGKPEVGIFRDLSGLVAEKGFSMINVSSAGRLKKLQALGETYNAALALRSFADKLMAGFFPSELAEMTVTYAPDSLNMFDNTSGEISKVEVVPRAPGIDLATVMLGTAIQSAKVQKTLGKLLASPRLSNVLSQSYIGDGFKLLKKFSKVFPKTHSATVKRIDFAAPWAADNLLLPKAPKSALYVKPFDYPTVNIMQAGYYVATSITPEYLRTSSNEGVVEYHALTQGTGKIMVQSAGDKFANSQIDTTLSIPINDGEFDLSPQISVSKFRQIHRLELKTFKGLDIDDFSLTFSKGTTLIEATLIDQQQSNHGGHGTAVKTYALLVKAPAEKGNFPASLSVKRKNKQRVSQSSIFILPQLTPQLLCLETDQQYTFGASFTNKDDGELLILGDGTLQSDVVDTNAVNLNHFALSIDGPGEVKDHWFYRVGEQHRGKSVLLKLIGRENKQVYDQLSLTIGCSCQWQANTQGQAQRGINALWIEGMGQHNSSLMILSDPEHFNTHHLLFNQPIVNSGMMTFVPNCDDNTVNGSWLSVVNDRAYGGGYSPGCLGDEGNPGTPEIRILSVTDNFVQAKVSGSMVYGVNAFADNQLHFSAKRISAQSLLNNPLLSAALNAMNSDPNAIQALGSMIDQFDSNNACERQ